MSQRIVDNNLEENEEESLLINPNDLTKRRRIVDQEEKEEQKAIEESKDNLGKIYNRGGQVAINYETMGRFDMPRNLYFKDFTIKDINDLALSRQEDLLENLVIILNKSKNENADIKIEDMLVEEFLETLVGIKQEFNSVYHSHPWVCECQGDTPEELQQVNESEIDLRTLNYKSIEQADEEIRIYFRQQLEEMSDQDFDAYLKIKYGSNEHFIKNEETIQKVLERVSIKEPIKIVDENNNIYSFRFLRIKDIIDAQKISDIKYASKIKAIKNKQYMNASLVESHTAREKEIENLKYEQAKDTLLFAKAFSLIEYNGEKLDHEKSINYYKKAPASVFRQVTNFLDKLQFGIADDRELTCRLCGKVSRRSLRQEFNFIELLPIDTDTKREQGKHSKLNIYIGI